MMEKLVEHLESLGYPVVHTREPGGTTIGLQIRKLLLDPETVGMGQLSEVFLFMADRAQHTIEVIVPALEAGKVVIQDRGYLSTLVYQCRVKGVPLNIITMLNSYAMAGVVPDLSIVFDVDAHTGLSRNRTAAKFDRFEAESLTFREEVRRGYLHYAKEDPERIRIINASHPPHIVFEQTRGIVESFLDARGLYDSNCGGGARGVRPDRYSGF